MRLGMIGNLITHARREYKLSAIGKFGMQLAFKAKQNMSFATPVIRDITGTVLNHAHTNMSEVAGAPNGHANITLVFAALNVCPIGGDQWAVGDLQRSYRFCGGKSVQTPSNTSAAMPMDSPSVGCG